MKKIATLASAAALTAASMTVSAWWGAPYGPYGLTEDQQKAMQEQQQIIGRQEARLLKQQASIEALLERVNALEVHLTVQDGDTPGLPVKGQGADE